MFNTGNRKLNRSRRREGGGWAWRLRLPAVDWKRWGSAGAALAAVAAAAFLLRTSLNQPIQTVAVEGRFQRVSPLDVEKAVRGVSRGEGLIAVELSAVSRSVRRIPWVDSVTVGRSWPHGLSIYVVEQVPVARWGETGLLNQRGEVFANDLQHVPAELPALVGPAGTQVRVTQRYLAAQGRLTEAGMRLSQVTLDARGAWEFSLDNGVVLRLGRHQVDERFNRFMVAASRIVGARAQDIAYIDLRYANGFAVGWRSDKEGRSSG